MGKSNRPEVNIRPTDDGDRMILRHATGSAALRKKLSEFLRAHEVDDVPKSITVGYFIELDEPDCAPAFMPAASAYAAAALELELVQRRLASELGKRIMRPRPAPA
jgi:hypothetical protein